MGKYGLAWIFASAILTMGANLLFRLGIERGQAGVDTSVSLVNRYLVWFVQPAFLGGIVLYGLAALVWFKVVSSQPLSTAYPILVGMTFLLVISGAVALFGESFTLPKLLGGALIIGGIAIISCAA